MPVAKKGYANEVENEYEYGLTCAPLAMAQSYPPHWRDPCHASFRYA